MIRAHRALLLLLVLFGWLGCGSPRPAPTTAPKAPSRADAQPAKAPGVEEATSPVAPPLLWQFRHAEQTVFLVGSVHVASKAMYPLPAPINAAFEASETVALEIVMDEANQAQAAQDLTQAGTLGQNQKLHEQLSPETYQLLLATLERHEYREQEVMALSRFKPWLISVLLTMNELARQGFVTELGIDEHFRRRALQEHKRLVSIESVDDQIALFSDFSPELEDASLRHTLLDLDQLGDTMRRAAALWQAGEAAELDQLLLQPMRLDYPELFKKMFWDRNVKMADFAGARLKAPGKHTTLMIVGTGHLLGTGGVPWLLTERGYSESRNR